MTGWVPAPCQAEDESVCAVCFDGEVQHNNNIVFCDSCDVAVHQFCYGVAEIPPGDDPWFCRRCELKVPSHTKCYLCREAGGAMKPSDLPGVWVHVTCATWVPGVYFGDVDKVEPVEGLKKVNRKRFGMRCVVCGKRQGAVIQCNYPKCAVAFHPMCMFSKSSQVVPRTVPSTTNPGTYEWKAFCPHHAELVDAQLSGTSASTNGEGPPGSATPPRSSVRRRGARGRSSGSKRSASRSSRAGGGRGAGAGAGTTVGELRRELSDDKYSVGAGGDAGGADASLGGGPGSKALAAGGATVAPSRRGKSKSRTGASTSKRKRAEDTSSGASVAAAASVAVGASSGVEDVTDDDDAVDFTALIDAPPPSRVRVLWSVVDGFFAPLDAERQSLLKRLDAPPQSDSVMRLPPLAEALAAGRSSDREDSQANERGAARDSVTTPALRASAVTPATWQAPAYSGTAPVVRVRWQQHEVHVDSVLELCDSRAEGAASKDTPCVEARVVSWQASVPSVGETAEADASDITLEIAACQARLARLQEENNRMLHTIRDGTSSDLAPIDEPAFTRLAHEYNRCTLMHTLAACMACGVKDQKPGFNKRRQEVGSPPTPFWLFL